MTSYRRSSPLNKLLLMIAEDKRELTAVLVYSFFHSLLFLAVPLAAQALVNVVVSGLYLQPLIVLTAALLFGLLAGGALSIARFYLVEVMRERIFARVALRVAERLPKVCHRTLAQSNGPEMMNRFFDVVNIQKSWFKLAYDGPGALLEILVGLVLLAVYGTELFGIATGMLILGVCLISLVGYRGLSTSLLESTEKYKVAEWLEEVVRCQDTIKVNSQPSYWVEETDRRVVNFLTERRKHFRILIRQKSLYYFLSAFALSGLLGMGGYLVIDGQLTLGQLVAAELVIWNMLKASQKMIGLVEALYDLLTGLEKVAVITAMETDSTGAASFPYGSEGAKVSLERVRFSHEPSEPLLDEINLQVGSGEMISILGEPGSGKSSLLALMAGFLKPLRGTVEIDDLDIREVDPDSFARNIGVLTSHGDIFAGSLLDNVTTGREASLHRVKTTLEDCGGRRLLGQLPEGAYSKLISQGRTLSWSERQGILLSRSMLERPRLLLIDDSLHALSERRQKALAEQLSQDKASTVISTLTIPPFIACSTRVYWLAEGKLECLGSPTELLSLEDHPFARHYPLLKASLQYFLEQKGNNRDAV